MVANLVVGEFLEVDILVVVVVDSLVVVVDILVVVVVDILVVVVDSLVAVVGNLVVVVVGNLVVVVEQIHHVEGSLMGKIQVGELLVVELVLGVGAHTLPVVPIYGPPGLLLHCILGRWHINGTSNGHSNHHRVLSLSYISFARFFDSLQHNSNNKDNRNIELGNMHNHIQYTIQGLLARKLFHR